MGIAPLLRGERVTALGFRSGAQRDGDGALLRAGRERRPLLRPPQEEGQASDANNGIRELGGVFGVAVFASTFTSYGGYRSGHAFVAGMTPAVYSGAAIVAAGSLLAFAIGKRSANTATIGKREPQAAIATGEATA